MTDPAVPATVPAQQPVPAQPVPAELGQAAPAPAPRAPAPVQPAPPKRRNTVGRGAFIFGLLSFLSPAIGVIAGFVIIGQVPNVDGLNFFNVLFFGAIGAGVGCALALVPIVLGIISLAIKNAKRLWGILGLVLGILAVMVGWIPLFAWITSGGSSGPTGVPLNG